MSGSTLVGVGAAGGSTAALPRRTRRSVGEFLRRAIGLAVTLAVIGCSWWALAPPPLGGSTEFVVVDGTSMLPGLRGSDLVALRPTTRVDVGDVVGYRSELLRRVVLHRVVAIEGDRYVFKGDNNGFVDVERPTRSQLVGKLWFRVPAAGRAIGVLHVPWVVALLSALLVFAFAFDGGGGRSRGEKREELP